MWRDFSKRWPITGGIMADPVIRITQATVAHQAGRALDEVSLEVGAGEFVGVLGPNGAGKTTLLTAINGLTAIRDGEVRVLGLVPHEGDGHRVRRRIGYVAQVERVDPRLPMTVRETVAVGLYGRLGWLRRLGREQWRRIDEALDRVGITRLAGRPLGHLSGGEYQRTAIARALAQDPEIFLFDEPTASIDPQAQQDILGLIQELHAERHVTMIYVTHELATLPEACARLVLMREGRVWHQGPREEMLAPETLLALYGAGNRT